MRYTISDMSFRWYLIWMGFGTGLAWVAWVIILMTVNPYEAGIVGLLFFFITLFLSCVGTLSLLGIAYRVGIRRRNVMLSREVRIAFRHALLVSAVAMLALWFSSQQYFRWYSILAVLVIAGLIEYVFLILESSSRQ